MIKNRPIVIMNFSGIYEQEQFYREAEYVPVDVKGVSGTNCYCDDAAIEQIQEKIREIPVDGMHFIDSGNYHYMSRIWLEKIKEPFQLLVFDNHTDMQRPAFGGILSCGGWIMESLEKLPLLKKVILVGPDDEAYGQVQDDLHTVLKERQGTQGTSKEEHGEAMAAEDAYEVFFLSREKLLEMSEEEKNAFFLEISADLPLYISVDKDVLSQKDACTTWSQGDMQLVELINYLDLVDKQFKKAGQKILGVDVCGECDVEQAEGNSANDLANQRLLEWFMKR